MGYQGDHGHMTRGRLRKIYIQGIDEIRKNGMEVIRKTAGDRRDWRRWTEAVPML